MVSKKYLLFLDNLKVKLGTTKDLDHAWLDFIFVWSEQYHDVLQDYDLGKIQKSLIKLASLGLGLLVQKYEEKDIGFSEHMILEKLKKLHADKNAGYSGYSEDSWKNFRVCESFGIHASIGCLTRLCDKYSRYTTLLENPELDKVNESIEDSLMDMIAYCGILICLLDEE